MPRQARAAGEFLHVIVRGIGRQILFEDNSDREKYLSWLERYSAETEVSILAYCLMENHVHLLLRDPAGLCPVFMKKMGISYAQYFNGKYDRAGHLFQDRYKSEIIEDDAYLLCVFRYILNNPSKAGFCRADEYRWSSYYEYGKENCLTNTKMLCEMIGSNEDFHRFMDQEDDRVPMEADYRRKDDDRALETLQKALNISSGTQLQRYDRQSRDAALILLKKKGLSIRQIERLTGINRGVIQKL